MTGRERPLIAHIVYSLGTGGLENGLVNIINRMPADLYSHAIICLTSADEFADRLATPDVQIVELHKKSGNDPGMYWRLWQTLRAIRPDIVHTRNLAALETQALGIFLPGIKRVHGEHGRDIHDLDGSNWKYRLLRRSIRPLIHRYITVSSDLADWLADTIAVDRNRIRQIYNGVDHSVFRPRESGRPNILPAGFLPVREPIVLGTVGRLAAVKDQCTLLRAIALLLRHRPEWRDRIRFVMVGDGPLSGELVEQVKELALVDLVWMTGDRSDIPALLQTLDVFVLPSLAEGISNTILEAMATGLPVVATDVGGNPELVKDGETGHLVPPRDAAALCLALARIIDSTTLRSDMGDAALRQARERFDWSRTVAEYRCVYDELLGRSSLDNFRRDNKSAVDELGAG